MKCDDCGKELDGYWTNDKKVYCTHCLCKIKKKIKHSPYENIWGDENYIYKCTRNKFTPIL